MRHVYQREDRTCYDSQPSEESFTESGRDKLLIIKKINNTSVYDPDADRAPSRTAHEKGKVHRACRRAE